MNISLSKLCSSINLEKVLNKKGYKYFSKGNFNLNIVGIRRDNNKCTNDFGDFMIIEYKDAYDNIQRKVFPCTTTPGLVSLQKPENYKGCAILVPDQYCGCWIIGKHKGKYDALVQRKPVRIYRDNNRDSIYDYNSTTIDNGVFGINIHKAGISSVVVNNWSAGCQVLANKNDFDTLMRLARKQIASGRGSTFTYTLLTEKDIK